MLGEDFAEFCGLLRIYELYKMFNSKSCQIVFKLGNKMKENPCLKRSDGLRRISTYFNAGTYHLCHFLLLQHYMFVNLFSLFFLLAA